jgi:hypothetical protein
MPPDLLNPDRNYGNDDDADVRFPQRERDAHREHPSEFYDNHE